MGALVRYRMQAWTMGFKTVLGRKWLDEKTYLRNDWNGQTTGQMDDDKLKYVI